MRGLWTMEMNRSRSWKLFHLNQMYVVEANGGEDAYAIVENNETNQRLLKLAGIPLEEALKYGDEEGFCVLSLVFGEDIANYWSGGQFLYIEELDEVDKLKEENSRYKKALEFYANEDSYGFTFNPSTEDIGASLIEQDMGETAQDALKMK